MSEGAHPVEERSANVMTAVGEARDEWVDENAEPERELYEKPLLAYLDRVRGLFEGMPGGRWGFEQIRRSGVTDALGRISAEVSIELQRVSMDHLVELRRRAYMRGAIAGAVGIAHIGDRPAEPAEAAISRPESVVIAGREIRITEAAPETITVAGMEITVDPEARPVPEPDCVPTARPTARTVVVEDDGRVWIIDPQDAEYVTLPGGGVEPGETWQAAAVRETLEETGLLVEIVEHLCDLADDHAYRRYYLARRVGGEPTSVDADGDRPTWVRLEDQIEAPRLLTSPFDRAALAMAVPGVGE